MSGHEVAADMNLSRIKEFLAAGAFKQLAATEDSAAQLLLSVSSSDADEVQLRPSDALSQQVCVKSSSSSSTLGLRRTPGSVATLPQTLAGQNNSTSGTQSAPNSPSSSHNGLNRLPSRIGTGAPPLKTNGKPPVIPVKTAVAPSRLPAPSSSSSQVSQAAHGHSSSTRQPAAQAAEAPVRGRESTPAHNRSKKAAATTAAAAARGGGGCQGSAAARVPAAASCTLCRPAAAAGLCTDPGLSTAC